MLRRILFLALIGINLALLYQILGPDKALQQYRGIIRASYELQTELEKVRAENVRLSRRIRLFRNNTDYRAKVVRTKMGFVKEDEVIYIPLDP